MGRGTQARSPVQMARAAAEAAMRNLDGPDSTPAAAIPAMPADEPMDPGTGVPDLNAILKRVRDQKKASQNEAAQAGAKKAYSSSAKRAAQAAAAEVVEADPNAPKLARFGKASELYARFRKPILLAAAAAVIAIGGLQLSSALLGGDPAEQGLPLANGADAPPATQAPQLQGAAPAGDAAAPTTGTPAVGSAPVDAAQAPAASALPEAVLPQATLPQSSLQQAATPQADLSQATAQQAAPVAADPTPRVVTTEQPAAANAAPVLEGTIPADPANGVAMLASVLPQDFGPAPLVAAAKTGDAKALFEIGRRMADNSADAQALKTAFDWFDAAAQTGFAPAQYRIGNMLEKGMGAPADPVAAKLWYQMAAEQGNASAMHNLAVLFANGVDGTPDPESAGRWFLEAADLGVADSQYNLGILSAKGEGVPQDLEESYKWFSIVAKAGDKDAAAKRDEVAKALRPEQLQNARAKADLWKPKALVNAANDIAVPEEWRISDATTASVDVKKAITNVQLILTKLGYDAGKPDGVMGGKTRNAIRAFQEAEKLPVTGEIDAALVKALLAKNEA
jgi:localization factor PodJL